MAGLHPNPFVDALLWGGAHWGTNINYYFGGAGVDLSPLPDSPNGPSLAWSAAGMQAFKAALQTWADVANITFTEVFNQNQAALAEFLYQENTNVQGIHFTPQDVVENTVDRAYGMYNASPGLGLDTLAGLNPGAAGFLTFVHEIGHALGLKHTFASFDGYPAFPGVTPGDQNDFGDNGLNQQAFSVMSYIRGWNVIGSPGDFGLIGQVSGPMAYDIAAVQVLYGAKAHNTGNSTYVLRHVDGQPDDLQCIWDTGGVDQIYYGGIYSAVIDLRAATLLNAPGGGGFVSYAKGAPGSTGDHWNAFTIANGVIIENATGGSNNDVVMGNDSNNVLSGLGANDTIYGFNGIDILTGGIGKDYLNGGAHRDLYDFNTKFETKVGFQRDTVAHFQRFLDDIDLRSIDAKSGVGGNQLFKFISTQAFHKVQGELRYIDLGASCIVQGDINGDARPDFEILVKVALLGAGDFLL